MAVILVEGFEHATITATAYNTNDSRVPLWSAYNTGASATMAGETSVLPGSWSGGAIRLTDTSGTNATNVTLTNSAGDLTGQNRIVGSFRFRFVSAVPSTNLEMFVIGMSTQTATRLVFNTTDDKLYAAFDGDLAGTEEVAVSGVLSADTWYYVDFDWNGTANPHTLKAKVDGANEATSSFGQAADTNQNVRIGSTVGSHQGTWIIDDLVLTNTGTDYPLGACKVYGQAPNSEGTPVNEGNFAQTGGTAGDWWTSVDSWGSGGGTFDSTEYIEQNVNGSGDYIEIGFEDVSVGGDTVIGASLAFTTWASTTGANGAIHWVYDGTTATTIFTGDNSDTAPRYQRWYSIPAPGAGWSESTANGLFYRCGGATAIPGNPRFGAVILQIATKTPAAVTASPPHLTNAATLYAPRIQLKVTAPHVTNAPTVYTPSVAFKYYVPHISNGATLYAPAVHTTRVYVPHLASPATTYTPTVQELGAIAPEHITQECYVYAPRIHYPLTAPHITNGRTLYTPAVHTVKVYVPLIANGDIYTPTVTNARIVPHIANGNTVYVPVVLRRISPPHITAPTAMYRPDVLLDFTTLTLPRVGVLGVTRPAPRRVVVRSRYG